ncbi:hypothetical protein L1987_16019 [Smallanthus sonchifolius]|uniref:Uncharacterized protein n=1 Tax=Smallanthus sonchifolius TaxID=185202 RepID=A0ACB9J9A8_9ASTR|nr:hypothetical protein L1987_16019 [Smallanthus sonchifolius]
MKAPNGIEFSKYEYGFFVCHSSYVIYLQTTEMSDEAKAAEQISMYLIAVWFIKTRQSDSFFHFGLSLKIIKEMNVELQEQTSKFRKQANSIAEWDRRI